MRSIGELPMKEKVNARLNKPVLAQAIAQLVKAITESVHAQEPDFWVKLELDLHIENGKARDKLARLNLYADISSDMAEDYNTQVFDAPAENEIPSMFFKQFVEH